MNEISFKLETITPLFMAGSDGRTPELRPPSFKGMMRFWWRAMRAEDDPKKLAEDEASIFGGTGQMGGKSRFFLRISTQKNIDIGDDFLTEIGFQKNEKRITKKAGVGYLLYSTYTLRDKGVPILRKYFRNDQKFDLHLRATTEEALSQALASLWLAIYFGGFGTRSRRGGGNLAILEVNGSFSKAKDRRKNFILDHDIESFIKHGFSWAKEIIHQNKTSKYSNLSETKVLVGIKHSATHWREALNSIGTTYMKYRTDVKGELFKGPHFGIPVMHSRFSTRLVGYQNDKLLSDRRGSPLVIKLIKCSRSEEHTSELQSH